MPFDNPNVSHLMNVLKGILVLILLFATHLTSHAAERFPWLQDLDEARELAAAEKKPLLIVFRCEP